MSSASTPASILDVSVLRDLQEAIGGDRAVAEELVHVFLTDAAELVNATGALAAQEPFDREAFRRTVHSLKTTSATFGAMQLSSVCRRLELDAIEDRPLSIDDLDTLSSASSEAMQAIREHFELE